MKLPEIGGRIAAVITAQGISQREFARRIGVSSGYLSEVINNHKTPGAEFLYAILREFGVSVDWLLTGEGLMRLAEQGGRRVSGYLLDADLLEAVFDLVEIELREAGTQLAQGQKARLVSRLYAKAMAESERGGRAPQVDAAMLKELVEILAGTSDASVAVVPTRPWDEIVTADAGKLQLIRNLMKDVFARETEFLVLDRPALSREEAERWAAASLVSIMENDDAPLAVRTAGVAMYYISNDKTAQLIASLEQWRDDLQRQLDAHRKNAEASALAGRTAELTKGERARLSKFIAEGRLDDLIECTDPSGPFGTVMREAILKRLQAQAQVIEEWERLKGVDTSPGKDS